MVEHVTENHGVGGSIPPLGTTLPPNLRLPGRRSRMFIEDVAKSHRLFARGFDYHRQFLDRFLPPKGLIGDIGSGTGKIAAFYDSPGRHFVSIDNEPETIAAVKWVLPGHDFRVGDAFNLPFADRELDAYLGLGIFELDGECGRRAMREAARVTKDLLYITVPYRNALRRRGRAPVWRGMRLPAFDVCDMTALLEPYGFEIVLARPSSIAHGMGPFRKLATLFPRSLGAEDEQSLLYRWLWSRLRPLANSLLIVARRA